MSQISQLSKLTISIAVSICFLCLCQRPSHSFPRSSATKSCDLSHNFVIGWCDAFFQQQECVVNTSCLRTLSREQHVFISSSCAKRAANMTAILVKIITPVLLGLSTQFKKLYIVWRPCQYIKLAPRLNAAPSRCYVILNQSHDLITPAWSSTTVAHRSCDHWSRLLDHLAEVWPNNLDLQASPAQDAEDMQVLTTRSLPSETHQPSVLWRLHLQDW